VALGPGTFDSVYTQTLAMSKQQVSKEIEHLVQFAKVTLLVLQ
jgi:hypothetical protein